MLHPMLVETDDCLDAELTASSSDCTICSNSRDAQSSQKINGVCCYQHTHHTNQAGLTKEEAKSQKHQNGQDIESYRHEDSSKGT